MYITFFAFIRKLFTKAGLLWILSFLVFGIVSVQAQPNESADDKKLGTVASFEHITSQPQNYFTSKTITTGTGVDLDKYIINGPPAPPPGYDLERAAVTLPKPDFAAGVTTLGNVPAFNWVFGCSAVSGAMIAGYYDRTGYPNMYTGPTDGGVMPLDNSSWPTWSDGTDTYPNLPLAATHQEVDGRTIRGSIDDYWVEYGNDDDDPYVTNGWTQHTWSEAIGDYMKTSQSAFGNSDGSTTFYTYTTSPDPLTYADMVDYDIDTFDGTCGRKLFYEARGYTVTDCYNQKTDNNGGGFSFTNYKAEIDAGQPVLLNLAGHSIVGLGYDDLTNTVYIHDTWDYSNHTMTWGGSYAGMDLLSVSVVNLSGGTPVPLPPTVTTTAVTSITTSSAASGGNVTADGESPVTDRGVCWSTSSNPTTSDSCTDDGGGIGSFTSNITGLTENTPYHVRAFATNSTGTGYGGDLTFTTMSEGCGGYTMSQPTYAFEDISSTGTALSLGDDDSLYFAIPFTFSFYGTDYTSISVGSNGTVYFQNEYLGFNNTDIPATNAYGVEEFIALFWDDLNPSDGGNVRWQVLGSTPNRRLIVQWSNVAHFGSSTPTNGGTFQAILYEGTNNIRLNYQDVDFGDVSFDYGVSATAGIQRDATCGMKFSYNTPSLNNSMSILFATGRGINNIVPILQLLLLE